MLYEESQSFLKNRVMQVVRVMFPILLLFIGYGLFSQLVLDRSFGTKPMSNLGLIITFIALALLFLWFMQLRLITRVSEQDIALHFSSLGRFQRQIPFESIKDVEVVTYNGLTEHGGWGLRVGPFGTAYTVHGNQAVKLTISDNKDEQKTNRSKTVYIGSQNPYDLASAIKNNLIDT